MVSLQAKIPPSPSDACHAGYSKFQVFFFPKGGKSTVFDKKISPFMQMKQE